MWPRDYAANLSAAPGETIFGAWLRIAVDGQITVAVPQAEHGQGAWTALPQIVADELGADWRTMGVEAAPLSPRYANTLAAEALFAGVFDHIPAALRRTYWTRAATMLTGASTSVRMFETSLREAGAVARVLLCRAAAARWGIDWTACDTADGFVVAEARRLRFGELAAEAAAAGTLPDPLPMRIGDAGRLAGRALPRLDAPAKVDGSATFAADVRLPDMVHASIAAAPPGGRMAGIDRDAARGVRGLVSIVENPHWVATVADDWWAADRALALLRPRFVAPGAVAIDDALERALAAPAIRVVSRGGIDGDLTGAGIVTADYRIGALRFAVAEPPAATAWWHGDRLELWAATRAPVAARAAAAQAIGIAETAVTIHPMFVGGASVAALETDIVRQAAILAVTVRRPVQLAWSRREADARVPVRAPARVRLAARLDVRGRIAAWQARIAAPATGHGLARRMLAHDPAAQAALRLAARADGYAVAGAVPPYRLPAVAIDHHVADIALPTGHVRGMADGYTVFCTETFVDDLAHRAGADPLACRMAMLGDDARLARCLSTAAALGGWAPGGAIAQGVACHAMAGSRIAVFAEVDADGAVERLVAAIDCGRAINPDLVRQQVEGGMAVGLAATRTGGAALRLADMPDVTVEIVASDAEPGGVSDIATVAVAPAIANAIRRTRRNPIRALPFPSDA